MTAHEEESFSFRTQYNNEKECIIVQRGSFPLDDCPAILQSYCETVDECLASFLTLCLWQRGWLIMVDLSVIKLYAVPPTPITGPMMLLL